MIKAALLALLTLLAPQGIPFGTGSQRNGTKCPLTYTTNLAAWWTADNPANTISGGNVTAWADKSGNGQTLTASTAGAYSANAINGLPAVTFNGSSTYYTFSGIAGSSETIFAVYTENCSAPKGTLVSGGGGALDYWAGQGGKGSEQGTDIAAVAQLLEGNASCTASWVQGNLNFVNGASATLRLDQGADGSATFSNTSGGQNEVGASDGAQEFLDGAIEEILIYTASLSGANTSTVESYLYCRTGL